MKPYLISLIILMNFGLQSCFKTPETTSQSGCPEEPEVVLNSKNVDEVTLNNQMVKKSGLVSQNKSKGYSFKAQKGQRVTYETKQDICVWLYSPENELLDDTTLKKDGKYILQVSAPKGSTTFDIAMGLDVDSSTPTPASTPTPDSTNSSSVSLTQDEALELVKRWQQAKRRIFASPFDGSLGAELLTEKAYAKNVTNYDSSMNWLRNNNAYYTYGLQEVNSVVNFNPSGNTATIEVITSEERTLCLNGRPSKDGNTGYSRSQVRYYLQLDQGRWKIQDYQTIKSINKTYNPNASC
jgi:hypothetical protein